MHLPDWKQLRIVNLKSIPSKQDHFRAIELLKPNGKACSSQVPCRQRHWNSRKFAIEKKEQRNQVSEVATGKGKSRGHKQSMLSELPAMDSQA